ncbi:MAG: right-handed parallel beta-helix repeat-containing protein, partial [Lentisphaeria bacterium]|nr:right-handed parallel beta-helix repeat-containing protein [Lentisphaeria bacterium]
VSRRPEGEPFLRVNRVAWDHGILGVGTEEKLTAFVECLGGEGAEATGVAATLSLPEGVRSVGGSVRELGSMPTGTSRTVEWTVVADSEARGEARVEMRSENCAPVSGRGRAVFLKPFAQLHPAVRPGGAVYYVDSAGGSNANSGASPGSAWEDFTPINGRTLNAGDRLLIKRGSVINQILQVSARGRADNWAEIGAYGTGPRPAIRRNWHIADRCALIIDPDYLWIHGLYVTCAASGILVHYSQNGHAGLFIEDCIASHIEGRYGGYLNSTGIPEWRDIPELEPEGYCGIMVHGARASDVTFRNCEMFHTSSAFLAAGERTTVERVFAHDCYVHNTSPHPYVVNTENAILQDCVLEASGGHASRGTMGIMLGGTNGFRIRNCTIRRMPDSLSADQGGVDYEAGGDGCLVDGCTFEDNAGAAIEVLGLRSPQTRNLEIRNSRFIRNNWVRKGWGPAEIYIWEDGANPNPSIVCSHGTVHGNGYVLLPGVEFFSNRANALTWWRLSGNTEYATPEELRRAMPYNEPPAVEAGEDIHTDTLSIQMAGTVKDDGRPAGKSLKAQWEVLEGPGEVTFANEASPTTRATFGKTGDYLLRLVGDDAELWTSDMVAVHVLPKGTSVAKAWEFNTQLDKEGWTEGDLGTRDRQEGAKDYEVTKPVKYVSGGYYVVATENSANACLLSPDGLGLDTAKYKTIRVRFQNHTPASRMRFSFATAADPEWNEANAATFDVTPNDNGPRDYAVDMSGAPGWKGPLKRLRFDLATGSGLTGTCRIDYLWVDSSQR